MKILYYIPYRVGIGADYWIYRGWKHAFEDLGHEFEELTLANEDWQDKASRMEPDLLLAANYIDLVQRKEFLYWLRKQGTKVALIVGWPMRCEWVEIIRDEDIADLFFGEREPESMEEFREATGRPYVLIPHAADKLLHFPTPAVEKYRYDVVYLGAYLRKKRGVFHDVLLPMREKHRVGIFGPHWTAGDNLLRVLQHACKTVRAVRVAEWINSARVSVPADEERTLYSSGKIALNFHEREEDGSQPHYIVNQRAYKIAACGGFQICDFVPALRKYFAEDEVIMATDPRDWMEKVEYFLAHDDERRQMQRRAAARALQEHTYHARVEQLLGLMDLCL